MKISFSLLAYIYVLFINGLCISIFTRNIPFYPMVVSHSYTWENIVNTFIFIQLSIYLMHLLFLPITILFKKLHFSINPICTWLRLTWIPWLHIYIQVLVLQLIDWNKCVLITNNFQYSEILCQHKIKMVYIDTSALKENVMADKDGNIHNNEALKKSEDEY